MTVTRTIILVVLTLLLLTPGRCLMAVEVDGSSSAVFTNPAPSTAVVSGVGTSFFTWGDPAGFGTGPSTLRFTGTPFSTATQQAFIVGTLDYFNGTIVQTTGATAVDLNISISLTLPNGSGAGISHTLRMINSPNTDDPVASADWVFLPTKFPNKIAFSFDGIDYILRRWKGTKLATTESTSLGVTGQS